MPDPFISEVKFLGSGNQDFIEIAVPKDLDVSDIQLVVYHPNGSVRTTNDLDDVQDTVAGKDVYTIDSAGSDTFNGVHKNGAVALVQDGNVLQFLSFENTVTATNGPAAGETSTALGATGRGESVETTDGGATYGVQNTPTKGTIPCFLSGTKILTSKGFRRVERLQVGAKVQTLDHGFQPILWAGQRTLSIAEISDPQLRPLRIPAHSFGRGRPRRDVYVSPNHRILVSNPSCELLFGTTEVFVAAKFLAGHFGIGPAPVALPITFHHLLFEQHQAIVAEGLGTESLFNGQVTQDLLSTQLSDHEAYALTQTAKHTQTARPVLKAHEAALLVNNWATQQRQSRSIANSSYGFG